MVFDTLIWVDWIISSYCPTPSQSIPLYYASCPKYKGCRWCRSFRIYLKRGLICAAY
jgi:hypothetical protein